MMTSAGVARGTLTIGTRASALALTQTGHVCALLRAAHPGLELDVRHISTRGDRITDRPLAELGRNGVFVTEIETALREGAIDLAVHSAKDLPSRLSTDMRIGALMRREDPRDVLISHRGSLASLPAGARVGTSSPRRTAQLRAARPDLVPVDIRGNVDTRLRRLASGDYDALLLAAAGLIRLGRAGEITEWLEPDVMLPAVGQGALALEVRADDAATLAFVAPLNDPATSAAVLAERSFLARLGADCAAVAAAFATIDAGGKLAIAAMIGSSTGDLIRDSATGPADDPAIGARLADRLLAAAGTPDGL
jgi:hydroxymethylbilane synthase